jgi:hypothetical protein
VKEAEILSIVIWEEMSATHEQVVDFPEEWADLLVALNQLKLATDTAAKARAEYLRPAMSMQKAMRLRTRFGNSCAEKK